MAKLSMECKKIVVEEIAGRLNQADNLIVTNYKGLSAQDLNELRRELREVSGDYVVVKDSMVKRALSENQNEGIKEFIEGEVGVALDKKADAIHMARVLVKFSKDHGFLKIRGGLTGGTVLSKEDIKVLASLPSRETLLGMLANVLNAPIQGLAGALNAIICKVLYVLNAVKDKKETEAPTPVAVDKPKEEAKQVDSAQEKPEEKKEEVKPETKEEDKTENKQP